MNTYKKIIVLKNSKTKKPLVNNLYKLKLLLFTELNSFKETILIPFILFLLFDDTILRNAMIVFSGEWSWLWSRWKMNSEKLGQAIV